jgi:hypothetical protein
MILVRGDRSLSLKLWHRLTVKEDRQDRWFGEVEVQKTYRLIKEVTPFD